MPSSFDVAIVGGGAVGWSCAWHLLHAAPKLRVAVLDPDPTQCTSIRGAGGFRAQFSSPINIEMSLLSIPKLLTFKVDTGADIRLFQNGYLLFTTDPKRAEALQELAGVQRDHGVQIEAVPIERLSEQVPSLNADGIVHAQVGLQDGFLDGPTVRNGYRQASLKLGALEIQEAVTGCAPGRVVSGGREIGAKEVVMAAGHWSGLLHVDLPVRPEKHQLYFVDALLPPETPFVIDIDTTFHYRPHGDQTVVCFNDPELAASPFEPSEPPRYDATVLGRLLPIAEHRAPGLMLRKQITGRAGYYGVTPDRHPMLGRFGNAIVATGFGGHGVMHSPAAGLVVSELILFGDSKAVNIDALSPIRFQKGQLLRESWVF